MGFSLIGTMIAIILLAPSLLMIKFPPKDAPADQGDAGKLYTLLERIGQVGCMSLLVISKNNFQSVKFSVVTVLMIVCIAVYYYLWFRYVVKGQESSLLYDPLFLIPIPMAVLPVCAFGFAALWGQSVWLGIAVVCLAIGHIANIWHSYQYSK